MVFFVLFFLHRKMAHAQPNNPQEKNYIIHNEDQNNYVETL